MMKSERTAVNELLQFVPAREVESLPHRRAPQSTPHYQFPTVPAVEVPHNFPTTLRGVRAPYIRTQFPSPVGLAAPVAVAHHHTVKEAAQTIALMIVGIAIGGFSAF